MKIWYLAFFISLQTYLLLAAPTGAQDRGTISGTVVDENSTPVSGARVNADPVNSRPTGSFVRYVETDASGHFRIDRLAWGTYRVFAKKEDTGYPDVQWSFYSNDKFPTAAISPTAPAAELQIKLGPKAGVLAGVVTNVVTGAPVNAGFKLIRAADPDKWISTSEPSNYRLLLPSSTDILVEVSAPGFRTWSPAAPLRLQPGAELQLDVPLEPVHDASLQPTQFLVPEGYVGWLQLEYGVKDAQPAATENGVRVYKFPKNGLLITSSPGPVRGADRYFLYYSDDGSIREIPTDYRSGGGMIWGQHDGSRGGVMTLFGFFVGSEEQYKKYQSRAAHPGPISSQ